MRYSRSYVSARPRRLRAPLVRTGRGERGSVFIVALMVLVMLTVIGLSLALVTETEMLIGGNEQLITETFYAAETGVAVAVTQLMTTNSLDNKCMAQMARDADDTARMLGVRNVGYAIDYTDIYPAAFHVAPYTRANEGRGEQLFAGFFRAQARAQRGSWLESSVPGLNPDAVTPPREADGVVNNGWDPHAEKTIDMAFFSAPLQALEAGTLVGTFDHPANPGCDTHPDHNEVVVVPPP